MIVAYWPPHILQQIAVLQQHPHLAGEPLARQTLCDAILAGKLIACHNANTHEVWVYKPSQPGEVLAIEAWIQIWHTKQETQFLPIIDSGT